MRSVATLLVVLAVVVAPAAAGSLQVSDEGSVTKPSPTVMDGDAGATGPGGVTTAVESQSADGNETEDNDTDVSPGQQLAGVVSVQKAEIEGEIEQRAFGIAVAQTAGGNARAAFVADRLRTIEQRLEQLEQRKERLDRLRENGSISGGEYKARLAELVANASATRQLTNRTAAVAADLPDETLEGNGVNVTKLNRLRNNASELTGPETAEIAREIAGKGVGNGLAGKERPDHAGPPDDRGNGSDGGPPDDHGNGNDGGPPDDSDSANSNDGGDGGPPDDPGNGNGNGGPPDDPGNGNGNGGPPDDSGNSNDGSNGNGGPPDDSGNGNDDGNGNGSGSPDDSGNSNDGGNGNGSGPPDDSGNGNDGGGSTGDGGNGGSPTDPGNGGDGGNGGKSP